jgi:hypothetical protein
MVTLDFIFSVVKVVLHTKVSFHVGVSFSRE